MKSESGNEYATIVKCFSEIKGLYFFHVIFYTEF